MRWASIRHNSRRKEKEHGVGAYTAKLPYTKAPDNSSVFVEQDGHGHASRASIIIAPEALSPKDNGETQVIYFITNQVWQSTVFLGTGLPLLPLAAAVAASRTKTKKVEEQ